MKKPSTIMRNGWSVRPVLNTRKDMWDWLIYPKGQRDVWSIKASLYAASDGVCYVVSMNNMMTDARPSFDAALDLVMSKLGIAPP